MIVHATPMPFTWDLVSIEHVVAHKVVRIPVVPGPQRQTTSIPQAKFGTYQSLHILLGSVRLWFTEEWTGHLAIHGLLRYFSRRERMRSGNTTAASMWRQVVTFVPNEMFEYRQIISLVRISRNAERSGHFPAALLVFFQCKIAVTACGRWHEKVRVRGCDDSIRSG